MCRAHGVPSRFTEQAWTAPTRTPPLYPDAVTLAPGADQSAVLAAIDVRTPGASVKDSFADLDLTPAGFEVWFEARWLYRPPGGPVAASANTCHLVTEPDRLRRWACAWDRGEGHANLFRPELLDDAGTFVLAAEDAHGSITAGAVAFRSADVVGISNAFAVDGEHGPWPVVLDTVDGLFPTLPVVTYDRGDDVAVALRHGFREIGPLRVWLRSSSRQPFPG